MVVVFTPLSGNDIDFATVTLSSVRKRCDFTKLEICPKIV